jgi:predicted SprT family Zn-dependent metalloprotease
MRLDLQDIIVMQKGYTGCPIITYKNPNDRLGENVTLIEKGEYRCRSCNSLIALYRKFNNNRRLCEYLELKCYQSLLTLL